MIREGENTENTAEPKPKNKEVETKQFPHNHTEVSEVPVGEDLEFCERFLQKEDKLRR